MYYEEDGTDSTWKEYLYTEQVEYKWENTWTSKRIYCTFNDGYLIKKEYH